MDIMNSLANNAAATAENINAASEKIYTLKGDSERYPEQLQGRVPEVVWKRMSVPEKIEALKSLGMMDQLEEISLDADPNLDQALSEAGQQAAPNSEIAPVSTEQLPPINTSALPAETASSEKDASSPFEFDSRADEAHGEFQKAAMEMRQEADSDSERAFAETLEKVESSKLSPLGSDERQRIAQETGQNLNPQATAPAIRVFGYQSSATDDSASVSTGPVSDAKTWAALIIEKVKSALTMNAE